jgi:hypothetical protein
MTEVMKRLANLAQPEVADPEAGDESKAWSSVPLAGGFTDFDELPAIVTPSAAQSVPSWHSVTQ